MEHPADTALPSPPLSADAPPTGLTAAESGAVVPKRKRGRPPGRASHVRPLNGKARAERARERLQERAPAPEPEPVLDDHQAEPELGPEVSLPAGVTLEQLTSVTESALRKGLDVAHAALHLYRTRAAPRPLDLDRWSAHKGAVARALTPRISLQWVVRMPLLDLAADVAIEFLKDVAARRLEAPPPTSKPAEGAVVLRVG